MAGEKDEVLQLLAASVYNYLKMNQIAFEDAMSEITGAWSKMREKKGYMKFGDEIVDLEIGIGFNDQTQMISLPIPPKEVQDEMIASIEAMNEKTGAVKERLGTVKDIFTFLDVCSDVGSFVANEETGERGLSFVYKNDRFMYFPVNDGAGMLNYYSESGGMGIDFFENDEIFRKVVIKLLDDFATD